MYEKYKENIARLGKKWEELNFSERLYWNTIYLIIMAVMAVITPIILIIQMTRREKNEILHRERKASVRSVRREMERDFPGGYVPGSRGTD